MDIEVTHRRRRPLSGVELLGPAARRLISPDRWTDAYPATPEHAKELDVLLMFADTLGCLPIFVPKLESRNAQRDEALEELRVAYWLHHSGFPVVEWEPPGLNGKVGEYLIGSPDNANIFVEVKSPGWEGVLSDEKRRAGRTKQPKYINLEGGAFGNWQPLQRCIASEHTYPKFAPTQPNLLVVADDLHVSLLDSPDHVEIALYADHAMYGEMGYFTSPRFDNLGGLAIFRAAQFFGGHGVEYEFTIFDNPFALPSTKLPDSILKFRTLARGMVRGTAVTRWEERWTKR